MSTSKGMHSHCSRLPIPRTAAAQGRADARLGALLAALLTAGAPGAFGTAVESVGEVVFAKGVATAQREGEAPRFVGAGAALFRGDTVETGERSFAVLKLSDGTRMTVRPRSALAVEAYRHAPQGPPAQDNAVLRLLRGGLRAVTGLLSRRNPEGLRIRTAMATIGIRGTEFDARLCADDCAREAPGVTGKGAAAASPVAGRVVRLTGTLRAVGTARERPVLAVGAAVFEGDRLESGAGSTSVIVFRDDTRVTLQPHARFVVERYRDVETESGNVALRLLRGGLRVLSGLLAKRAPGAFSVRTAVATIGIRGTGFDLLLVADCRRGAAIFAPAPEPSEEPAPPCEALAPEGSAGLYAHSWEDGIRLENAHGALELDAGQSARVADADAAPARLPAVPGFLRDNPAPRPDGVPADLDALFGAEPRDPSAPGLYVSVEHGHVTLFQDGRRLDLGAEESGYADPGGRELVRLASVPAFLRDDRYPRPQQVDPRTQRLLDLFPQDPTGARDAFQCLGR